MSEKLLEKLRKTTKNSSKTLPKVLKSLGKIESVGDYDEWKQVVKYKILEWAIDTQIRAFIIFFALICLSATPHIKITTLLLPIAEGISLTWFLLIELKRDLWRKGE